MIDPGGTVRPRHVRGFDLGSLDISFGYCRTPSEPPAAWPLSKRQAEALMVAVLWPRHVAASAEFVVAASATDKDQCHQPDAQCKREYDAEPHRYPTGGTDFRIAEADLKSDDHDTDRQHQNYGEHHREEIAGGREVLAKRQAG